MLQSEIIQRTPSIYFRFDDDNQRGYSKSSFALDYSISNHKQIMSNKFNKDKTLQSSNKNKPTFQIEGLSPYCQVKKYIKQHQMTTNKSNYNVNPLSYQRNNSNSNLLNTEYNKRHSNSEHQHQQHTRLETQDFFKQFDTKYDITFEKDHDVFVNQWILQVENQEGSKISKGNLFEESLLSKSPMAINNIQSTNKEISPSHIFEQLNQQEMISSNIINFTHTNQMAFSRHFSMNQNEKTQTQTNSQHNIIHRHSMGNYSPNKQNHPQNHFSDFEEAISFGPSFNNQSKVRKYRQVNNRHFVSKDFQNNSSLLEKTRPGLQLRRRVPLKIIENIIQKNSKERQNNQTRKKPIINADLFVSTINKAEKNHIKLSTNCPNSNPVISKKSSSLESTFCYDNMFKTNAFRQTLKSTTLQNWRRKHHKKIQNIVDRKTISKKHRDSNIFDNLFIRG